MRGTRNATTNRGNISMFLVTLHVKVFFVIHKINFMNNKINNSEREVLLWHEIQLKDTL
jgi:hypothetical protein